MMKYANYLILVVLVISGFLLKDSISISTNLLSLFASKESIHKLHIANELGYSKEMFVAVEGFSKESKKSIKALAKEFEALDEIAVVTSTIKPSKEIQKYYRDYHGILAEFDAKKLSNVEINARLTKLYEGQLNSFIYNPINKNDPLELFRTPKSKKASHKGKYITLEDYGYLIKITTKIEPSQMDRAKLLYDRVHEILKSHPKAVAFAPFFYSVENSAEIKGDVKYIVALSTIILLLIYLVMLRDVRLLSHTFVALISSMIFATLVCTTTIPNFGVLSLAFGTSLTAVSIDYFFHYYFHNFYGDKRRFDRSVFYGFMTTVVAFGVFSFISVPMISQISTFALLSLSFAYLLFTFVFPYLEIKNRTTEIKERDLKVKIPYLLVTLISIGLLAFSVYNLRFDSNIRNLDYQNIKLQNAQKLFAGNSANKLTPVIVEAKEQEELLTRLHELKKEQNNSFSFANFVVEKEACNKRKEIIDSYDFEALKKIIEVESKKVGFREGYFSTAYDFTKTVPLCENVDLEIFKSFNLSTYKENELLYTIAMVQDQDKALSYKWVSPIDVKAMFAKVAQGMFENITLYSSIVLVVIFSLLLFSVRKRFFYALNYILFPLGFTLTIVTLFYEVNIMHLFSLIILIAIGIDYGIYMSNSNKPTNTMLAIKYSLLSTFAAFGVLLFSSITALYSIGIVISLGVSSIFLLTRVMR